MLTRRHAIGLAIAAAVVNGCKSTGLYSGPRRVERPYRVIAEGLRFPEGPIATSESIVYVSEIAKGCITRIGPDGRKDAVACVGGAPNGLAFGPDGWIYNCNGGGFAWREADGLLLPAGPAESNVGGWIERIKPETGEREIIYEAANGRRLRAPNDIVFDNHGGFWFTDTGVSTQKLKVQGGLYYARNDGSAVNEVVYPLDRPNGVGLSPDGKTVYVALTTVRDLLAFSVTSPGVIEGGPSQPGKVLASFKAHGMIDSLAMEANGNICVTPCVDDPGIAVVSPQGHVLEHIPLPDIATTNLTFGGKNQSKAYVTQSSTGKMLEIDWPRAGLKLPYSI